MADDPKDYQEEEYVFSDEGTASEDGDENMASETGAQNTSSQASFADKLLQKRKEILIGLGLIVVVVFAYEIIGSLVGSSTPSTQNPLAPPVQPVQPIIPVHVQAAQAPVTTLPQMVNSYSQDHAGEKRLSKLEADTDGVRRELDDMANTNTNLQASVDQINAQLTQLSTMVAVLTDKVQSLEQPKTEVKKVVNKKVVKATAIKVMSYSVMAVIPGRAWLKASDGSTMTVAQGTMIPGYGTVVSINPQQGAVNMSSGNVIQFSTNEL